MSLHETVIIRSRILVIIVIAIAIAIAIAIVKVTVMSDPLHFGGFFSELWLFWVLWFLCIFFSFCLVRVSSAQGKILAVICMGTRCW